MAINTGIILTWPLCWPLLTWSLVLVVALWSSLFVVSLEIVMGIILSPVLSGISLLFSLLVMGPPSRPDTPALISWLLRSEKAPAPTPRPNRSSRSRRNLVKISSLSSISRAASLNKRWKGCSRELEGNPKFKLGQERTKNLQPYRDLKDLPWYFSPLLLLLYFTFKLLFSTYQFFKSSHLDETTSHNR